MSPAALFGSTLQIQLLFLNTIQDFFEGIKSCFNKFHVSMFPASDFCDFASDFCCLPVNTTCIEQDLLPFCTRHRFNINAIL